MNGIFSDRHCPDIGVKCLVDGNTRCHDGKRICIDPGKCRLNAPVGDIPCAEQGNARRNFAIDQTVDNQCFAYWPVADTRNERQIVRIGAKRKLACRQ